MEELDKNLKSFIGQNLSGAEMMRLCSTNRNMRRQCMSDTMAFYWKNKLKEDFHIDYNEKDSFNEYLRQSWLGGQELYVLDGVKLFRTKRDALNAGIQQKYYHESPLDIVYEISNVVDDLGEDFSVLNFKVQTYKGFDYYSLYEEVFQELNKMLYPLVEEEITRIIRMIIEYISHRNTNPENINEKTLTRYILDDIVSDNERAEKISKIFIDLYNKR